MTASKDPICYLFDNGSLRPASTQSLRRLGAALEREINAPVRPVSLLHSSGIDPRALDGQPAELLEPALLEFARSGGRRAVILPLFFGPSAALTEYLPQRLAAVQRQAPGLQVLQARWLVDAGGAGEQTIAQLLTRAVREVIGSRGLHRPAVLLTDHGSPQPEVTAVREALGRRLANVLGDDASFVGTASMERRPGPQYAFSEPLLESALRRPPFNEGEVVVALQFLQPGRHAAPDGDVATICRGAEAEQPRLRTHLTEPLAAQPGLIGLLAQRYREAIAGAAEA